MTATTRAHMEAILISYGAGVAPMRRSSTSQVRATAMYSAIANHGLTKASGTVAM